MRYLIAIMQVLSVEIKTYNIGMKTTKCINTAIMLTYILSKSTEYNKIMRCEVGAINARYARLKAPIAVKNKILMEMKNDLENKNDPQRYLYYIILTNNTMARVDNSKSEPTAFFPGHVFIIDKQNDGAGNYSYRIYQSYVNKYDLTGHYRINNNTTSLNKLRIKDIIAGIDHIINNTWDEIAVQFWTRLTGIDTSNLIGYSTAKHNLCYTKIKVDKCYSQLLEFTNNSISRIEANIAAGNMNAYAIKDAQVMDINTLLSQFKKMQRDIETAIAREGRD
jgi:hypothetical protein